VDRRPDSQPPRCARVGNESAAAEFMPFPREIAQAGARRVGELPRSPAIVNPRRCLHGGRADHGALRMGQRDGMKSRRECTYTRELDLETLVWMRGLNSRSRVWMDG
jgi:hypothetical protein